jgi:hypothetical protein
MIVQSSLRDGGLSFIGLLRGRSYLSQKNVSYGYRVEIAAR